MQKLPNYLITRNQLYNFIRFCVAPRNDGHLGICIVGVRITIFTFTLVAFLVTYIYIFRDIDMFAVYCSVEGNQNDSPIPIDLNFTSTWTDDAALSCHDGQEFEDETQEWVELLKI